MSVTIARTVADGTWPAQSVPGEWMMLNSREAVARFAREARAAVKITSEDVVRLERRRSSTA